MEELIKKKYGMVLFAMISCALWGAAIPIVKTSYRIMNIGVKDSGDQIVFAGIRFAVAGILVIIYSRCTKSSRRKTDIKTLKVICILCLLQTVGQYIPYYLGLARTSGVSSSILVSTNAFFAVIISAMLLHQEKMKLYKIVGCMIGFVGVVAINVIGRDSIADTQLFGNALILLSAVFSACSSTYMKKCSADYDAVMLSGSQFFLGGIILTAIGFICGGRIRIDSFTAGLLLLALSFISAVAFSIWSILLKYNEVSKVTVNGFMIPIFGVIYSVIILNEGKSTSPYAIVIALVCVSIGIVLENK